MLYVIMIIICHHGNSTKKNLAICSGPLKLACNLLPLTFPVCIYGGDACNAAVF